MKGTEFLNIFQLNQVDRGDTHMSKTHLSYFEEEDILHLALTEEPAAGSVEVSPNITAELNDKGEIIGLEILNASQFIRDSILDSVQTKISGLSAAPSC